MNNKLAQAQTQTAAVIDELLADGSNPDALYLIEHHISSSSFDILEKVAIDAFKLGYEATDPEEFLDQDDQTIYCFDIVSEIPLNAEVINAQIAQLIALTEQYQVNYDGWGTYFEGDEEEYDEEEQYTNNTIH
ncbi:ribonuclease E inhibitor RraB [Candidatus Schmidhempelia bombi]|uniref:Regulator of ribonuclease activity B n=1 Tax=Candidatus Schmidhempelia bombi str. Bimp TaxID=1387197 RepID=A0AB94IBL3_9GAMM|nr:ribonuclease E inhibitor RraB [Candidatus Schmidhempelia bombi]TEA26795.1 ribonuclease E inhibitor RraB [Candidatus Schmidhempelia bombi str. Bimp]